ncbi:hypothetical protein HanXRQr2_Chr06g0240861 [Helianthus annuus]|uniref:Uncharacterized protein n=1 Tax=Helianthus annuus TaxID=4232 RepID=A0A9K3IQP8_HELAN|nr:hypothetical protein HanXRQr2_Chr06g0240861 [Helianthus annuus]
MIPISRSSSAALFFKNTSLVFTLSRSGITWTSVRAVAHDTAAVKTLAVVITIATVLVCTLKVHKLIRCVAPHRTIKAPN